MGLFQKLFGKKNKQNKDTKNSVKADETAKKAEKEAKPEPAATAPAVNNTPVPEVTKQQSKNEKPTEKRETTTTQKRDSKAGTEQNTNPVKSKATPEKKKSNVTESATVKAAPAKKSTSKSTKSESDAKATKKAAATSDTAKKSTKETKAASTADDAVNDIESDGVVEETVSIPGGTFEIKKAKDGRYVFNLYASNHVIVATSQVYSSSSKAMTGINSVIANAPKAGIQDNTLKAPTELPCPKWEIYLDNGKKYRFRLIATNGSCVCHSQGYTTKANCKNGIESIIRSSHNATVDKAYLKKADENQAK